MLGTPRACLSLAPRHPLYSSGISSPVSSSSSTAGLARAEDTGWVTLGAGVSLGCPCRQVGVWGALTGVADGNSAQQGQGNQQAGPHGAGILGTQLAPLGDPRAPSPSATLRTPPWALCHPQHPVLPTSPQKHPHIPTVPLPSSPVPPLYPLPPPVPSLQIPALLCPSCAQFLTSNPWVTPSPEHPVPFCPPPCSLHPWHRRALQCQIQEPPTLAAEG